MHEHGAWHWVHCVSALSQQPMFVSAPHKFPPCFRHLEGMHKVLLVPQAPAQHSENLCYFCHCGEMPSIVLPRAVLWSSPTHFTLCSSNSPGWGRLSLTCLKTVSPSRPFWILEKKGSFMLPCLQGHLHWSLLGYSLHFQSHKTNISWDDLQSNLMNHIRPTTKQYTWLQAFCGLERWYAFLVLFPVYPALKFKLLKSFSFSSAISE